VEITAAAAALLVLNGRGSGSIASGVRDVRRAIKPGGSTSVREISTGTGEGNAGLYISSLSPSFHGLMRRLDLS
jgi:hypothetical protein